MLPIKIVTDSTSDITQEEAKALGIGVVPLHVILDGKDYRDGIDLNSDQFFAMLPVSKYAKTSQPNVAEILEVWERTAAPQETILSVHITSKLSKTYDRAVEASRSRSNVKVIDSLAGAMGLRFLVSEALEMVRAGTGTDAIVSNLEKLRLKLRLYAVLDTLYYLKRGGRIGKVEFLMGSILGIKPVITLKDGELAPVGRSRTKPKAISKMVEIFLEGEDMKRVGVIHTAFHEEALKIKELLKEKYPGLEIPIVQLGPTLGVHSGPGLVGICGMLK